MIIEHGNYSSLKVFFDGKKPDDILEGEDAGDYLIRKITDLQQKHDALVAENVGLKECAKFYSSAFYPEKGTFGLEWKPKLDLLDDCGNIAHESLKSPTTDAVVRELMARGVERALVFHEKEFTDFEKNELGSNYIRAQLQLFAQQLREGGV